MFAKPSRFVLMFPWRLLAKYSQMVEEAQLSIGNHLHLQRLGTLTRREGRCWRRTYFTGGQAYDSPIAGQVGCLRQTGV
jgi:hypothetical protein